MDIFSLDILLLLFSIAIIAGIVDTVAGGGGLLTIPVLFFIGLSPIEALSTNKLQGTFGTLTSSIYFIRKKFISLHEMKYMILFAFLGSILGCWILLQIDASTLKDIIPILLILIGFYFLLSKDTFDNRPKINSFVFAFIIIFVIGAYDGFFGPGTGSFFTIFFVSLLGYNISRATAKTKVLNFTTNFGSLLFFIFYGQIYWTIGLIMGVGQILGGIIGAKLVIFKGQKIIRPLIIFISFGMSLKLLIS